MKLIVLTALAAALSLPVAVSAQQAPPESAVQQAPAGTQQATPKVYRRWSRLLNGVNLSNQQHDQIQNLLDRYAQAHPAGSQHVAGAAHQLHDQIFGILTQQQQTQVQQNVRQMRTEQRQRRQQKEQQQQQQQNTAPPATR